MKPTTYAPNVAAALVERAVIARAFVGSDQAIGLDQIAKMKLQGPFGWDILSCGHWVGNPTFGGEVQRRYCLPCALNMVFDAAG